MVVARPLLGGPGVSACGCRPRECISTMSARCRSRKGCGSVPSRPISGGGAGVPVARPRWPPKAPWGGVPADRWPGGQVAGGAGRRPGRLGPGPRPAVTLARVAMLIARLADVRYMRGTSYLLKSIQYPPALIDADQIARL